MATAAVWELRGHTTVLDEPSSRSAAAAARVTTAAVALAAVVPVHPQRSQRPGTSRPGHLGRHAR
ncbi:hypothetical protein DJ64_15850 [Streptomyces griseorubens]|uniref:Uncharacterized protein n=1 Tax=Streptomyces griseorubens TaxID=66897 RepID=A0ABR4T8S8_9ACTN|nr:hypothetical protein DJ64_15850 [Streptomyces griseorubens]